MRTMKEIFGYLLGGLLFVGLIPAFMWLLSGMPAFLPENWVRLVASVLLAIVGLTVSVWSIVHMRRRGNGNPMDAFGHEVAPRTRHLMTDGPYRLSRNPMLTGTFVYLIGVCVWLWTWQALAVYILFVAIMLVQVSTEEARLRRDFSDEYEAYCHRTGRFLPF
ncbi:MAG: isoprenylcysteine carboxylmethyltransferase family protein [Paludibacteraceae bacterium]|nr:isoprenylcysteine carboxylmethyltransferase family protein [Paludibacteraceae bacterium]